MYNQPYKKIKQNHTKTPFLPQEIIQSIILFFKKLGGLLFIIFAAFLLISLFSYNKTDPSFSCATSKAPSNFFGASGAFISSLLLQFLGYSAYLLVLFANNLGLSILKKGKFPINFRHVTYLILSLLGISFLLSHLIFPTQDFLTGGIIGMIMAYFIDISTRAFQKYHAYKITTIVIAFLSCISLIYSMRWNYQNISVTWSFFKKSVNLLVQLATQMYKITKSISNLFNKYSAAPKTITLPDSDSDDFDNLQTTDNAYNNNKITEIHEKTAPITSTPSPKNVDDQLVKKSVQSKSLRESLFESTSQDYHQPSIDLLDKPQITKIKVANSAYLEEQAQLLKDVLEEFGVKGTIEKVSPGPVVTLFEFAPAPGIKIARVIGLADDIARSMSALSTRIAVIPGRTVIGIELPNQKREVVYLRDVLESKEYVQASSGLPLILGKNIGGQPIIADLAKMPHLLVAGTTGSGKSVAINTMILSLLYRLSPDQCKFIMVDPKMLELSVYNNIPHLLSPVVTDPKQAVVALKWTVREMENRYRSMSKLGVRNIDGFNTRLKEARKNGEVLMRRVQTGFDPDSGKPIYENQPLNFDLLPYIVVVVDEMADLMLVAGKEIELTVQRLAQMARAAGIHLIMATQRPSVDVITGTIKANFPTRISFQVTSKIDSRTILGEQGAEQLLGQGDMLFMAGGGRISRVHGPYVRDDEVEKVVSFLKTQGEPSYIETITQDDEQDDFGDNESDSGQQSDEFYQKAVDLVLSEGKASTSFVQRHLQIGYNRAARIIEQMEKEGIITAANRVGKREVIGRTG